MICENCGAKIGKKEKYCPKCGQEIFNSNDKPLQQKYLRDGYFAEDGDFQEPYQDWDNYDRDPYEAYYESDEKDEIVVDKDFDNFKDNQEYKQLNHQRDDSKKYSLTDHADDHLDHNQNYHSSHTKKTQGRSKGYKQGYKSNKKYKSSEYDHNKGHTGDYISKKPYKGKYSGNRSSGNRYKKKREYGSNYNKNYYKPGNKVKRGYDLDEYYGSQEKKSSMTGTIVLFLVMALLMGLVIGFIFFATNLNNIVSG
ncbi:MAG: hypothetical protein PWQ15_1587 [Methanobacterium sp.]|jgi:predicted nucleic acid-binding Zn ribbon protein|uniref:zinc ribbon domain-containing protein n=1 Tax=Methanobacterium sp. TaxID=2164 RepID=UPI0003C9ACE5|nr:zinc-ribbon domain-containing protein [Methanobacterium sp.]MDI3550484.1 hypothetical protein [Methanobacterium sp.]CDG64548.1 hypothetical protein MBMB1_0438 [Methanobacterium sp. MB1]